MDATSQSELHMANTHARKLDSNAMYALVGILAQSAFLAVGAGLRPATAAPVHTVLPNVTLECTMLQYPPAKHALVE